MTTIAVRERTMAADSMESHESEGGGSRYHRTSVKLYRKTVEDPSGDEYEVIIGTAGEVYGAMVFVDWYPGARWLDDPNVVQEEIPRQFEYADPDFIVLILEPDRDGEPVLYEADCCCRPVEVDEEFWAIGSGCKAALAAMHLGKSAIEAVEVAAKVDTYTRGPFVKEKL